MLAQPLWHVTKDGSKDVTWFCFMWPHQACLLTFTSGVEWLSRAPNMSATGSLMVARAFAWPAAEGADAELPESALAAAERLALSD